MMKKRILEYVILAAVVLAAYANTLFLDYALDDRMIIFENDYTLQGWQGVDEIFTKDAFTGYFNNENDLVAGGRYRPLSQLTFVAEYELYGGKLKEQVGFHRDPKNEALFENSSLPVIQHAHNVLIFMVLCMSVLAVLKKLFPPEEKRKWYLSIPFVATLLFALHPLHTEAVANIKGRDELMAMLGAIWALYCSLRYVDDHRWHWLLLSFLAMSFGLFSKESAITFLAVVPLGLYFYPKDKKVSDYVYTLIPLVVASVIFLIVRYMAVGLSVAANEEAHLLNNPFRDTSKVQEVATVLFTWAIYLKLMLFPHPLTHDYYPNQIEVTNFANPVVWLVIVGVILLLFFAIRGLRRKSIFSFAVLYFIITFSITSNLLFNVGTFMNERFVFTPLLGFTLIVASLIDKWSAKAVSFRPVTICLVLLCLLYAGKTVARNLTWKNDLVLFTTDVKTSDQSMKCNLSAGGSYILMYEREHKSKYLTEAEKHLLKAVALGRSDVDTYSLLGKLYFLKNDFETSKAYYELILREDPGNAQAKGNLDVVNLASSQNAIVEINKKIENNEVDEALKLTQEALKAEPESPQFLNAMGRIYGEKLGKLDEAVAYLEKAVRLDPQFASAQENLGIAYAIQNQFDKAVQHLETAHQLEPDNQRIIKNLTNVYVRSGQPAKAEALNLK